MIVETHTCTKKIPRPTDLSVLVPVYNEELSIPIFWRRLASVLKESNCSWEVVFIDDASRDGSVDLISAYCLQEPRARLVRHSFNQGRGRALWQGICSAQGEFLLTLDADLENPPEIIPRLLDAMTADTACISGWRQDRRHFNFRGSASLFYNMVMRVLTGLHLNDFNCGMKLFRRSSLLIPEIRTWLERDGDYFRFVIYLLKCHGHITRQVPLPRAVRIHGKSRYSVQRYLKAGRDFLKLLLTDKTVPRPL